MSARRALVSATEAASRTSRRIIITPPAILRARVSRISTPTTASAAAAAALRFFTHTMSAPSRSPSPSPKQPQQPQPRFSAGTPAEAAEAALPSLLLTPGGGGGGRWRLTANGEGLEREFKFGTFAKTWDFMTAVSLQCKLKNHHPEWSNVFNTTFIRWTTHDPKGLSTKDLELAAICDSLARDFKELVPEPQAASACDLPTLANKAVGSAGDCCAPKE